MLKRKLVYLCICLTCIMMCACSQDANEVLLIGSEDSAAVYEKHQRENPMHVEEGTKESFYGENESCEMVRIYMCGAVKTPGVVEIPKGSRVEDALRAAGEFREDADRYYVNLADWVTDGQMIYVPTVEETASGQMQLYQEQSQIFASQSSVAAGQELVNINTADATLLCTLPGIGESRAADIIAYRQKYGLFQSCKDIMSVPGIKQGVYEKICDKITVDERLGP